MRASHAASVWRSGVATIDSATGSSAAAASSIAPPSRK
jgi:hypothetical protein